MTLSPAADTNPVGTSQTVTAMVMDATGQPVANVIVRFTVTGSLSASGQCTTGATGTCTFTYQGPAFPGTDTINAYADSDANSGLWITSGDGIRWRGPVNESTPASRAAGCSSGPTGSMWTRTETCG